MNAEWQKCLLADVSSIIDSLHQTPKYTDTGFPMVRVTDIRGGYISLDQTVKVDEQTFSLFTKKYVPKKGDILISRVGSYGLFSYVNTEEFFCLGQNTAIISPNIDDKFLYYSLMSPMTKSYIEKVVTGSTQKTISLKDIKTIPIYLPTIVTQKRVSGLLSSIDEKIETNKRINDNLLQQSMAIFDQEFLSFDEIPVGWQESSLLGVADYLNGLAMQRFRPQEGEQSLPVLKIKELRQGFCDSNSELCSPSIKNEYIVHDGDVIFSWSGSLLVDFWCGGICGLNQHLFKITSAAFDKWFYYAWTYYHLQEFVAIAADKATTMGHIKREDLSKAKVLIPPKAEYDRIGALLAPIYDLVIANRIQNHRLAELRDQLLPRLISGEIDVSSIIV